MKLFFTSVGRRVELVQAFRNAAERLHTKLEIYGADIADSAPALAFCDHAVAVPRIKDPRYIPELRRICKGEGIDALIPTIDTELMPLAENRENFGSTKVVISKPEKVAVCRDKRLTADYFKSVGLKSPHPVDDWKAYKAGYPAFIKPRDGSSSAFAYKVENEEELKSLAEQVPAYIIQTFVDGTEYTVDIFCDFDGKPIYITPRERMQLRAGEVLKTKICMDDAMIHEAKALCRAFKPCGPMTVQLIRDKNTGENYYIEINPRFGGGSPLSMKSGARSAEALLQLLRGEVVSYQPNSGCNGVVYSRFDQSVCISGGDDTLPMKGVIFDLDDTLYSEKQYVRSGHKKVGEYLGREDAEEKLWGYFLEGKPAIDCYLQEIGEADRKAECLEAYREQIPEITLYDGAVELIQKLKSKGVKVGIITDGRVSGQKKKIQALGLDKLADDIIITDELGGTQFRKPCDISFRIMQRRWGIPFEQMVYVGDNADKDFQAPKQLGMRSVWFQNEDELHKRNNLMEGTISSVSNFNDIVEVLA